MTTERLTPSEDPAPDDVRALQERLYEYNVEQTGHDDGRWLALFVRDAGGRMVAGLHGWTWGGWLKVSDLWIERAHRREGLGTRLLQAAEDEARARGCRRATLSTYSFQAPLFYQKHGYRVVGVVDDMPAGHRHYTLVKELD